MESMVEEREAEFSRVLWRLSCESVEQQAGRLLQVAIRTSRILEWSWVVILVVCDGCDLKEIL